MQEGKGSSRQRNDGVRVADPASPVHQRIRYVDHRHKAKSNPDREQNDKASVPTRVLQHH